MLWVDWKVCFEFSQKFRLEYELGDQFTCIPLRMRGRIVSCGCRIPIHMWIYATTSGHTHVLIHNDRDRVLALLASSRLPDGTLEPLVQQIRIASQLPGRRRSCCTLERISHTHEIIAYTICRRFAPLCKIWCLLQYCACRIRHLFYCVNSAVLACLYSYSTSWHYVIWFCICTESFTQTYGSGWCVFDVHVYFMFTTWPKRAAAKHKKNIQRHYTPRAAADCVTRCHEWSV